jgi:predicted transcriptional regulator of viral defense system
MTESAPSASFRLLQRILETAPAGRVFTSQEAVVAGAELGFTPEHTYKLLTQLVDRSLLDRPRGRLYVMKPPFGGLMPVRPLVIAVHAVTPVAVSGDTALSHWGLLEQAPLHEEIVSTPARIHWRGDVRSDGADRLWHFDGSTIRFHHVRTSEMFGIVSVRLDNESVVPMFDRERCLIELLSRPEPEAARWAEEILREHASDIDRARLRRYAERLETDRPRPRAASGRPPSAGTPALA